MASTPRMHIERILVPIDFSTNSMHALAAALSLTQRFGAELLLLHVVEPVYAAEPNMASADLTTLLDAQERTADERLGRILVECGVPAQVIMEVARRTATDLIVIATHGRTGLSRMLIGSVAERVVRRAGCPVLTVPPAGKQG